ncbi:50S ribosome-binding GTPase [Fictibacillus sp. WQ 8-8]|uniref:FeoB small GTPase domain-containing protein n=1 Tax=unclassified Fictibacillus TaxID=2644029 RepID=UPI0007860299|nr:MULTISPECIES: FeoB small GTPase domain-containing protein [unclassified Fictibacillus]MCQ6267087.1 50S ribosome-binding GTPase [Fictibacillus sp. WQ 8-8]UZJ78249.1 50S ribosome-binding GTPase [Fictibacillus sp. KU28468]
MTDTFRVALAGNPNTGKSTLFNALTGLKQHTGNWAGKTVSLAEGTFRHKDKQYRFIDLPGTYSIFSNSADEEVARNYIIFEKPHITLVVVDATSLERNLNLALQILEMTKNVVICINLIDEADKRGITINERLMARRLGVPVIKLSARNRAGFPLLLDTIDRIVSGKITCEPAQVKYDGEIEAGIASLEPFVKEVVDDRISSRWVALRLLDGDESLLNELNERLKAKEETVCNQS